MAGDSVSGLDSTMATTSAKLNARLESRKAAADSRLDALFSKYGSDDGDFSSKAEDLMDRYLDKMISKWESELDGDSPTSSHKKPVEASDEAPVEAPASDSAKPKKVKVDKDTKEYTAQPGDTLAGIVKAKYGLEGEALKKKTIEIAHNLYPDATQEQLNDLNGDLYKKGFKEGTKLNFDDASPVATKSMTFKNGSSMSVVGSGSSRSIQEKKGDRVISQDKFKTGEHLDYTYGTDGKVTDYKVSKMDVYENNSNQTICRYVDKDGFTVYKYIDNATGNLTSVRKVKSHEGDAVAFNGDGEFVDATGPNAAFIKNTANRDAFLFNKDSLGRFGTLGRPQQ